MGITQWKIYTPYWSYIIRLSYFIWGNPLANPASKFTPIFQIYNFSSTQVVLDLS